MRCAACCGEGESQRVSRVQQTLGRARRGKHAVVPAAMIQYATDRIRTAGDTWCHMHAGKRSCGAFRYDSVTEMQVLGLDALGNAAGHDSPARPAQQMIREGLYRQI